MAIVFLVAGGCGDDLPWQAGAAEEVRELPLLDGVGVVRMSRSEFAAQAREQANAQDEAELREYAETYGRLGFFDPELDLRPILASSASDWVGATYSPSTKKVTLVGEARDDIIVHEFVHALQDQHFDLIAYDDDETSDGFLARRAAVEGDATLAQYRFALEESARSFDDVDWMGAFDDWRSYARDILDTAEYPVVFLDYVSFVYAYGFAFSAGNLTGASYDDSTTYRPGPHDWERQNELFTRRPPTSTQEVLRGGVDGSAGDAMAEVGLDRVPAGIPDLITVDWDRLGEWYLYLLLFPLEARGMIASARQLAAAWDGDRVLFVQASTNQQYGVVWASAWDDPIAAANIVLAMWALYGVAPPLDGSTAMARDGEVVWIEARGNLVVVAKNVPDAHVAGLVDAAFGQTPATAPRLRPSMAARIEQLRATMFAASVVYEPTHQ